MPGIPYPALSLACSMALLARVARFQTFSFSNTENIWLLMSFFQAWLRSKSRFSAVPYKPVQAPYIHFSSGAYASTLGMLAPLICRFMPQCVYCPICPVLRGAPMRPGPARGARLASSCYGIGTAAASAIIHLSEAWTSRNFRARSLTGQGSASAPVRRKDTLTR